MIDVGRRLAGGENWQRVAVLVMVVSLLGTPVAVTTAAGSATIEVGSTFDDGDEGWLIAGDAQGDGAVPIYRSQDGNPGGAICAEDDVSGNTWYFSAPAAFQGDKTQYYNGTLSFDLKQSQTTSQFSNDDIVLRNESRRLAYDFGNASAHPGTNWTRYDVPLSAADSGWTNEDGEQVSERVFRGVLDNVSSLLIRGEYVSGADTGCLDNPKLVGQGTEPGDAEVVDGRTYYQGQVLWSDAFDANAEVDLLDSEGSLVSLVFVTQNGTLSLSTADLSTGSYTLQSQEGPSIDFRLVEQSLSVSTSPSTVSNTGSDTTAAVTIESNRDGYPYVVTVPGWDGGDIDAVFPDVDGTPVDRDGDGREEALRVSDGGTTQTITADMAGVAADEYTITVSAADSVATDSATIAVHTAEQGTGSFAGVPVYEEQRGDIATIPVSFTDASTGTIYLGSQNLQYLVRLDVTDGEDEDSSVSIRWNTHEAGVRDTADSAFGTVSPTDTVTATRLTGQLSRHIAADTYPMNLSVDGFEADVGTVSLVSAATVDRSVSVREAPGARSLSAVPGSTNASGGEVSAGDWLVFSVETGGIFGYIDDASALTGNGTNGVSMSMTAAEGTGPAATVDLGAFHFVELPSSDRFLLVGDTSEIDIEPNREYTVTFAIEESNPYVTERVSLSQTVTVRSRASVSVTDQFAQDAGTLVTVDSVSLPEGGFVAIHDRDSLASGDRTGSVLGTSSYVSPGISSDIQVRLDTAVAEATEIVAMAHNDTDGNHNFGFVATGGTADTPYDYDGSPVTDNATVRVPTTTTTPTPTSTSTTTTTTTATTTATTTTPTATPTTSTTVGQETTEGDAPGFGFTLVAIALLAGLLAAVRRP